MNTRGLLAALVFATATAGCGPSGTTGPAPAGVHPDGERGHGWFAMPSGPREIDYVWHDGQMIYDWDIVLDPALEMHPGQSGVSRQALLGHPGQLKWTMNAKGVVRIPYWFKVDSPGTAADNTKTKVKEAMAQWVADVRHPNGSALFDFVQCPGNDCSGESPYVTVHVAGPGNVCFGGPTHITAHYGCAWKLLTHEVGHVLTYEHEQKRHDRAGHVDYFSNNVESKWASQFSPTSGSYIGTTYDSYSVMHYDSCSFSKFKCNKWRPSAWVLARSKGTQSSKYIEFWTARAVADLLSPTDICGTKRMYKLPCTGSCTPTTCAAEAKNCGSIDDGCGGTLECGSCTPPDTCGGSGKPNVCGCTPATCQGKDCGKIPDGCGGTLHCGGCTGFETCGGGGTAHVCGCTPTTCAKQGKDCGTIPDGCGGTLSCGSCSGSAVCGGGGPNVCGSGSCAPTTCAAQGKDCGKIADGCGAILNCGTCAVTDTCGGGGTPNVCGCTPTTCADEGKDCGTLSDGCGGSLDCGACSGSAVCGGGGVPGVCADAPLFPVSTAMAGTIQSEATGTLLCATGTAGGIVLDACVDGQLSQQWGYAPTAAFRNGESGSCMQSSSDSDGAPLAPDACSVDAHTQQWQLGDVELVNGTTGLCITVPHTNYVDGQKLVYRNCSGASRQRFAYLPDTHEIKAQGWCVTAGTAAGDNVKLHACDGSDAQAWIESGGGFASRADTTLCLGVQGSANAAPGAPIELRSCNGKTGQMWGLRGHISDVADDFCVAGSGNATPLALASCVDNAADQTFVWWPRASCVASTCADLGASCGSFDDGCGNALDCGICAPEPSDGGVGHCDPATCETLGATCGTVPDGCGDTLDCGPCPKTAPTGGCSCNLAASRPVPWFAAFALLGLLGWRRGLSGLRVPRDEHGAPTARRR